MKITAIRAMELKGSVGQSLIRVDTDAGVSGVGEAGAAGKTARAHIKVLEPLLLDQDPLEIDKLFNLMIGQMHTYRSHIPTVSGIDIALWDLAGKILNRPVSELLSGRFREEITLYYTAGPANALDKTICREWADEVKVHPDGYRILKCGGIERFFFPEPEIYETGALRHTLTQYEMNYVRRGHENIRDSLGEDYDIIVHCHNEWDLPTAIRLSNAVEPIRPLWIEDALPVWYSESWKAFKQASRVSIVTGEKLELAREFLPFFVNGALDAVHPDLCFSGGISGCRRIADLADLYYIPVAIHNVGTMVQNAASIHFGASVRNFLMSETRIYDRPFIKEMVEEEFVVRDGQISVPKGPGLGITLIPEVLKQSLPEGEPFWD